MSMSMNHYIDKIVEVDISGKTTFIGKLVDLGLDVMVLYNGHDYLYIPLLHIHRLREVSEEDYTPLRTIEENLIEESQRISYRNILQQAKGKFIEIYVTGGKSLHGYITSVLNDYLVFYSPVYKNVFVSLHHLKWLTPYSNELTPYSLSDKELPVRPASAPFVRNFEEQLKKYENQLVVLDLGDQSEKIGVLKEVSNNIVELITANGESMYWKLAHVKSVHLP